MSIEKHPRDKLSPIGNNSTKMNFILGIGNKPYRKAFQNIYSKIFKKPLGEISQVMAHDVGTASASYLDKFKYTEEQRKKALEEINAQLQLNAAILLKNLTIIYILKKNGRKSDLCNLR
jgi:hypothetical protein